MKTFLGIEGYFDMKEFIEFMPGVKLLTFCLAIVFILGHGVSGKVGGFEKLISKSNSFWWGLICGTMLCVTYFLQPSQTVDFIYFRF